MPGGKVGCSTIMLRAAEGLKAAQNQLRFLHIRGGGGLRSHQYHWSSDGFEGGQKPRKRN